MRPEEREEAFRQTMEAYTAGDLERTLGFYHPEIEVTAPDWMNAGPYRGHEGFLAWSGAWYEAWESWAYELKDVRAIGERHVVARVRVSGRGRTSSIEIDQEIGFVVEMKDGLTTYIELTLDEEAAMKVAHEREVSN